MTQTKPLTDLNDITVNPVTGETNLQLVSKDGAVRYTNLTFRYSSRQTERQCHKRWKKLGWSDQQIAEFERTFGIARVQ